jgi:hypothetical protein
MSSWLASWRFLVGSWINICYLSISLRWKPSKRLWNVPIVDELIREMLEYIFAFIWPRCSFWLTWRPFFYGLQKQIHRKRWEKAVDICWRICFIEREEQIRKIESCSNLSLIWFGIASLCGGSGVLFSATTDTKTGRWLLWKRSKAARASLWSALTSPLFLPNLTSCLRPRQIPTQDVRID